MQTWRRIAPIVLAGLLLLNLVQVITTGARGGWIVVALLALALASAIWQRRRRDPPRP